VILSQPIGRTKTFEQSFQFAGPALWKKLPSKIRHSNNINQFQKQLKTHLFSRAYGKNNAL
jgi:DNA-binding transcriptional regulator/RsmH inhibitor MraZ